MSAILQLTVLLHLDDEEDIAEAALAMEEGARESFATTAEKIGVPLEDLTAVFEWYGVTASLPRSWETVELP